MWNDLAFEVVGLVVVQNVVIPFWPTRIRPVLIDFIGGPGGIRKCRGRRELILLTKHPITIRIFVRHHHQGPIQRVLRNRPRGQNIAIAVHQRRPSRIGKIVSGALDTVRAQIDDCKFDCGTRGKVRASDGNDFAGCVIELVRGDGSHVGFSFLTVHVKDV